MTDDGRNPLAHLEPTPANHFSLHIYAAVLYCIAGLTKMATRRGETLADVLAAHPFLQGYLDEIRTLLPPGLAWAEATAWWDGSVAAWELEGAQHAPLCALAEAETGTAGRIAVMLAGLAEEDSRFGTLFASVQPLQQRRASWELVVRLLDGAGPDPDRTIRALLHSGLLQTVRQDVPRAERQLLVPGELWDVLREGVPPPDLSWCDFRPHGRLRAIDALHQDPRWLAELRRVPPLMAQGHNVVVRGATGSGRGAAIGAIAHALGLGTVAVESGALEQTGRGALLGPLCLLTRSMPVVRYAAGPGETVQLPDMAGYPGALGVVLGQEGGVAGVRAQAAVMLSVPPIGQALRQREWLAVLDKHAGPDLEAISAQFRLSGEHIRRIGALAITQAALQGRAEVQTADVQVACRDLRRQALDSLAVRLEPHGGWDDLVVSEAVRAQLRELELRCRHRETLLAHLNPAIGQNTGVRALFSGPSGTGKTMTARILAAVLGMELYRVDLAAVINKYIGETEKNLSQVLARAEELDVVLLLDEGDSLLAKRSEVRSSNDRHANMETNYLLQRLESYQGIVLVTTNYEESIDRAFQRRMDVVANFALPQPAERLRIWQGHLPPRHTLSPAQLEEVALRCAFTGGQIRNAAVKATLLAVAEGGTATWTHLVAAIQGEYAKGGSLSPFAGGQASRGG